MVTRRNEVVSVQERERLLHDVHVRPCDLPPETELQALKSGIVAIDTETTGLDWQHDSIATVQAYVPHRGVYVVRVCEERPHCLLSILANPKVLKVFHYAAFDLRFIVKRWPTSVENIACTKVASKILSGNGGAHHLKDLVSRYLGIELNKECGTSDWFADELTEEQIRYAARDAVYLPELLRELEDRLEQSGKLQLAHSCFAFLPTQVLLDLEGVSDVFKY